MYYLYLSISLQKAGFAVGSTIKMEAYDYRQLVWSAPEKGGMKPYGRGGWRNRMYMRKEGRSLKPYGRGG